MSDDLATLETQRSELLEEFLRLGDLRPGSITAVTRRCGKPSCHCAKHNDPGHDPQFRLTRRVSGKTVTETFPNPTALRKAQQEVAEFHRFQKLSQDLVALNDRICRLRPVAQATWGLDRAGKKTAAAIHQEVAREVNQLLGRIFAQRRKDGRTDLEAVESALRTALHQAGAAALSELLQFEIPEADQRQLPCPCGHHAQYQEIRCKPILTIVGLVRIARPYYLCSHCHVGQFPADVELDIENTEFSPGVRRMQALVGQEAPFDHGREQMKLLAGLEVTTKSVERTAEAIGERYRPARASRDPESPAVGSAGHRRRTDSHLVCANGRDRSTGGEERDVGSARQDRRSTRPYAGGQVGMCVHANHLGRGRLSPSAIRIPPPTPGPSKPPKSLASASIEKRWNRGWSRAKKKVVIGDGAEWIWNLVAEHFPERDPDCRSLPCSPAPVGGGAPAVSP